MLLIVLYQAIFVEFGQFSIILYFLLPINHCIKSHQYQVFTKHILSFIRRSKNQSDLCLRLYLINYCLFKIEKCPHLTGSMRILTHAEAIGKFCKQALQSYTKTTVASKNINTQPETKKHVDKHNSKATHLPQSIANDLNLLTLEVESANLQSKNENENKNNVDADKSISTEEIHNKDSNSNTDNINNKQEADKEEENNVNDFTNVKLNRDWYGFYDNLDNFKRHWLNSHHSTETERKVNYNKNVFWQEWKQHCLFQIFDEYYTCYRFWNLDIRDLGDIEAYNRNYMRQYWVNKPWIHEISKFWRAVYCTITYFLLPLYAVSSIINLLMPIVWFLWLLDDGLGYLGAVLLGVYLLVLLLWVLLSFIIFSSPISLHEKKKILNFFGFCQLKWIKNNCSYYYILSNVLFYRFEYYFSFYEAIFCNDDKERIGFSAEQPLTITGGITGIRNAEDVAIVDYKIDGDCDKFWNDFDYDNRRLCGKWQFKNKGPILTYNFKKKEVTYGKENAKGKTFGEYDIAHENNNKCNFFVSFWHLVNEFYLGIYCIKMRNMLGCHFFQDSLYNQLILPYLNNHFELLEYSRIDFVYAKEDKYKKVKEMKDNVMQNNTDSQVYGGNFSCASDSVVVANFNDKTVDNWVRNCFAFENGTNCPFVETLHPLY